MLLEFSIENFLSFSHLQTLQMQASAIRSPSSDADIQYTLSTPYSSLLATKALYGANGSGKSNWIKAFGAFIQILKQSVKYEGVLRRYIRPFKLSSEHRAAPSFFQMVYMIEGVQYRYGFEANQERIHSEWLFVKHKKEVPYFIRENDQLVDYNKHSFSEIEILVKDTIPLYRSNSLILSVLATFGRPIARKVWEGLTQQIGIFDGLHDTHLISDTLVALQNPSFKQQALHFLQSIDPTITDVKRMQIPWESLPHSLQNHWPHNEPFGFISIIREDAQGESIDFVLDQEEAQGTRKMFYLAQSLFYVLQNGYTFVIDELDARLHPLLTRKFIAMFHHASTNPKGAQLIFATHDTSLLQAHLFRRDQIALIEKDKQGASHIRNLVDFRGISNNRSFERDYMEGKFGAVPYLGQIDTLFMELNQP